ncbi:MAG: hypothetical protein PWQ93_1024 [Clostridiales bacterium]|nr:hypothetical protein [Clostridiales bacterium]
MRKNFKKGLGVLVILALLMAFGINQVFAQAPSESITNTAPLKNTSIEPMQDTPESLGQLVNSTDIYDEYLLTDPAQISKEVVKDKLDLQKGQTVKKIITRVPKNLKASPAASTSFTPAINNIEKGEVTPLGSIWLNYYVYSTTNRGDLWYWESEVLHTNSGGPGGSVNMIVSQQVSAKYSCNVGISVKDITAGVGFDVTRTFGISDEYSHIISPGHYGYIKSWAYYHRTDFTVYNNYLIPPDTYAGTGSAYRPNGVRFRYYEI